MSQANDPFLLEYPSKYHFTYKRLGKNVSIQCFINGDRSPKSKLGRAIPFKELVQSIYEYKGRFRFA